MAVVDDQALGRGDLVAILGAQAGMEVVGQAASGVEPSLWSRRLVPTWCSSTCAMPVMDEIETTRRITTLAAPAVC